MNPEFDVKQWQYLHKKTVPAGTYYYVRLTSADKHFRVKGEPGSLEFLRNYDKATKEALKQRTIREVKTFNTHRIGWLTEQYLNSAEFDNLRPNTQKNKLSSLTLVKEHFANCKYNQLEKVFVTEFMQSMKETPAAANQFLTDFRAVLTWSINQGYIENNVLEDVKKLAYPKVPHKPWSNEEMNLFANKYDYNTQERLAFELLSNMGSRPGDIIRVGPKNLKGDVLHYVSEKTKLPVTIRITPELQKAIDAQEFKPDTFLYQTMKRRPYPSYKIFYSWLRFRIIKLGIRKTPHGIRKTVAIRQLEAGATIPEAMATQGWKDPTTLIAYGKEMDREKIGLDASKFLARSPQEPTKRKIE